MTTTAAAEKVAGQVGEKKEEKVEKRRALGRGLESLLPGPRVVAPSTEYRVASTESRVPSTEPHEPVTHLPSPPFDKLRAGSFAKNAKDGAPGVVERQAPQGLKPEASSTGIGTAEAVPFPTSLAPMVEPTSQELEARRTGVSAPHEPAALAAGQPGAAVPTLEQYPPDGVISIQAEAETRIPHNLVTNLPLEVIEKNPYQTRYVFDKEMLRELADSIKEHGVVQPVVVRPAEEEGRYILVLGERRLRASRMAGKETIPALVRRLSLQQAAEMTVLENVVREDLNCLEQAEAFRVLSTQFKLTQVQIADRIGVSRETVSNYMRLLRLPEKVMGYMLEERLSFSDARLILALENAEHIEALADEVVTKHMKWDEIEDRVMRINGSFSMLPGQTMPGEQKKKGRGARWMDPNVRAAQTEMERTLGMRVRIRDRNGKGRIVIEYASVDDYERVTGMLRGSKK
jgi:ParB family chromosome partitioning protein